MIKLNSKDITPMMNGVQLSRVMYNGKQVWPEPMNVVEVQLSDTVAGDVCAYDGSNKRFFRFVDSGATDDIRNYTPIGVVVVPASHTDDGTARVMSLATMDYNNPDEGNTSSDIDIHWGGNGYDVPNLDYKTQAPYIGTAPSVLTGEQTLVGWTGVASPDFSSDYYDNEYPNPYDEGTCFGSNKQCAPSPYLTGGAKNEIYHSTANTGNAYADMNGKSNTEKILAVDNGDSTAWKTASAITNTDSSETIHPAAQCCWRYNTIGTTQGDWYLPAGGEIGYLVARWKAINASISKVTSFGFSALSLLVFGNYWSSTKYSSDNAVYLFFSSNYTGLESYYNVFEYCVRAFLAVSPLDISGVSPSEASNGVYIYANNGKLYTPEEWNTANNDLAVGVAVVTDNCKFCISKAADSSDKMIWSDVLATTDIPEISENMNDLNGLINSAIIRQLASSENETNNASMYCYSQTITVGEDIINGYLPAIGEWREASDNKDAIENALNLIGGVVPQPASHWSSTEFNIGGSKIYSRGLNWGNGGMVSNDRNMGYMYVRPFFPIVHDFYISANKAPNGVYIYDKSGALWKHDKWNTRANSFALGVAVITDNCRFVIDKTERNNGIAWSNELYGTDVSGILSTTDPTTAQTDFAGENNSRLIREAASEEDSSNNAAYWCYEQTITVNGATKHGYLAAAGEWQAAYDNKSAVDNTLSKIRGAAIPTGYRWSSTEYGLGGAWALIWSDGYLGLNDKVSAAYAVPVYTLD